MCPEGQYLLLVGQVELENGKAFAHPPLLRVCKCYVALPSNTSECAPGLEAVNDGRRRN